MELVGTESSSGWVSDGEWMWSLRTLLYIPVDFINTVHLGYTKFIKQHKIKSCTRESDAIKRCCKHGVYEATTDIICHTVL